MHALATVTSWTFPGVTISTQGRPFTSQTAHGPWSFASHVSGRYHWPRPPFCASRGAVDLDAGAVDEQPVGSAFGSGQRAEDVLPDPTLGPAHEAIVERLLGAIDRRAITPAPAALQGMDDPQKHPAIIDPPCRSRLESAYWVRTLVLEAGGGAGGIRTLDTLLAYTHFPGERLRPLGHRSAYRWKRAPSRAGRVPQALAPRGRGPIWSA